MEDIESECGGRTHYRICGYCQSNERDASPWFTLDIRLNGRSFFVRVLHSRFHNSPSRSEEFYKYFAFFASGVFGDEQEEEENGRDLTEGDMVSRAKDNQGITIDECFDWAISPFLQTFHKLAPQHPDTSKVTLQHFFGSESFECELGAIDDRLVPGEVTLRDPGEPWTDFEDESPRWTTTFPLFSPSLIEIISSNPQYILDDEPRRVLLNGQEFFFKSLDAVGEAAGKVEIGKHEQIARANFGPQVQTSRLFGVVQDEKGRLLGLLLDYIDEGTTLAYALEPETSEITKNKWAAQIKDSLAALHEAGVVWGDVKPDNVIIDTHEDAWIIDFGGGYTQGWVDKDKAGTIEGDLQGLGNILKFISTGG